MKKEFFLDEWRKKEKKKRREKTKRREREERKGREIKTSQAILRRFSSPPETPLLKGKELPIYFSNSFKIVMGILSFFFLIELFSFSFSIFSPLFFQKEKRIPIIVSAEFSSFITQRIFMTISSISD